METTDQPAEFVGHKAAAAYIGIDEKTLSGYTARGTGPRIAERRVVGQYLQMVYLRKDIDTWMADRPGQGKRTDLIKVEAD